MKMTLHRALAQRKTTKARITKEIETGVFIETTVGTSGKVKGTPIADVERNIRGSYDRILALIGNFYDLSTAINRANNGIADDTTNIHTVDFDGKQATLSSILAAQEALRYRKQLVEKLRSQLGDAQYDVTNSEMEVAERCDQFLASMGGGDKKSSRRRKLTPTAGISTRTTTASSSIRSASKSSSRSCARGTKRSMSSATARFPRSMRSRRSTLTSIE